MGFLSVGEEPQGKRPPKNKISDETLHRAQCTVCPLGKNGGHPEWYHKLKHPQMAPWGAPRPLVYMLGEAPGDVEDRRGRPFVGPAGAALRMRMPDWANDKELRWSNVVRTRPYHNETPEREAIESCRPSVTEDIEKSKPFAVFGFGNIPLKWAIGEAGITTWTGRHFPIKIGKHTCWFFPIVHPSAIIRGRRWDPRDATEFGSDAEFGFALDVERAFDLVQTLPNPVVHTREQALADIECITGSKDGDVERVLDMLEHCANVKIVGYDYETNRKRPYEDGAKLLSLGLSTKDRTMALALEHKQSGFKGKALERVYQGIEDFLYDSDARKVVHALAFEMEWTAFHFGKGSLRAGLWGDTMSQAYVLDERMGGHSLDFLCRQYFGIGIKALSTVNVLKLDNEPLDKVLIYQGVDARYHRHLYNVQREALLDAGGHKFYEKMLRRVPTMVLTQYKGIPIHQPRVRELYAKWLAKRTAVEEKIQAMRVAKKFRDHFGSSFRPSATHDVKKILDLLGVTGLKSVDEDELKKVKDPVAEAILSYREAHKILSTYILPVLDIGQMKLTSEERKALVGLEAGSALMPDGRMHPVTTTTKTRTSRSASEDTNYQNWPKRDNKEIRSQVAVLHGWKLCSFDYGQIQARNVGMESLDKALIDAFWKRYDIHHDWTERIVALYPKWMDEKGGYDAVKASKGISKDKGEDLWKWYRDRTKNLFVFPSFFGAQPPKLSTYLDIPQPYTEKLAKMFWKKFPSIHAWQQGLIDDYYKHGYTTSLAGHRRHAPISTNEIINAPIQADEAEIVCNAMARLSELGKDKFQANMEIHDDLTFIWRADEVEENALVVVEHMVMVPYDWANVVPIVVEMSIGDDWAAKTDVGNYASDTWERSLGIDDATRKKLGI